MDNRIIFVSLLFLCLLLISPIPSSVADDYSNNGYDLIHTRVIPDDITLVEPESITTQFGNNYTKYNFTYEIWNPTSSPINLSRSDLLSRLLIGKNFTINFLYYNLEERQSSESQMVIQPGLSTYLYVSQSMNHYHEGILYDGINEVSIIPDNEISSTIISLNSTILLENSTETEFYPPDLPSSWGDQDPQYDKLMIAVTSLDYHQYNIVNTGRFRLDFKGEYWNPTDRTLYTSSSSDCLDRLQVRRIFSIYNDYAIQPASSICHLAGQRYELEQGVHTWEEFGYEFEIHNLNDTTLPDGVYTFYFQIYQNPDNIHYAYLTAENGTYTYSFDEYPDDWESYINPITPDSNNSASLKSLLGVNYLFSILFFIFILSYRSGKPKKS